MYGAFSKTHNSSGKKTFQRVVLHARGSLCRSPLTAGDGDAAGAGSVVRCDLRNECCGAHELGGSLLGAEAGARSPHPSSLGPAQLPCGPAAGRCDAQVQQAPHGLGAAIGGVDVWCPVPLC